MKDYGFLSFDRNMSKNISKNVSENLSDKYSQKRLDHAKVSPEDRQEITDKVRLK